MKDSILFGFAVILSVFTVQAALGVDPFNSGNLYTPQITTPVHKFTITNNGGK